ncbi:MAG: PAS domain S-box protein [Anaerolineae bacterium]|nr:PAS domain S-box protein [Anaerolineae bacterium]
MMSPQDNEALAAEIAQLRQRLAALEAEASVEPSVLASASLPGEMCSLMFDSNPYPMWVCHAQTFRFLAVNRAAQALYGYTVEVFLAMTLGHLLAADVPLPVLAHVPPHGWHKLGVQRHCKQDGMWIDVEIDVSVLSYNGQAAALFMACDVTRRLLAEESWRKTSLEFYLLSEAASLLSRTLDLQSVYDTMYKLVSPIMDCDDLFVSSYNAADGLIRCAYARHNGQPLDVSLFPPIPLEPEGFGTQSLVIRSGQALIIPDLDARLKQTKTKYYVDENVVLVDTLPEDEDHTHSALIVPIKVENQVIGVIQVASYHYNAYTADHQRMLEALMAQVGAVSVNAALYQQAQNELAERRQAEQALRESEARYRSLFEHSPVSLWEEDFSAVKTYLDELRASGISDFRQYFAEHPEVVVECVARVKILNVNRATHDLFQVSHPDQIYSGLDKLMVAESVHVLKDEVLALLDGKTWFEGEVAGITATGKPLISLLTLSVVEGYEQTWGRIFVAVSDITERKQTEQILQESRQRYKALVDSIDGIVWEVDLISSQFTFVSQYAEKMLGYPVEQWLADPHLWINIIHPDDRKQAFGQSFASTKRLQDYESAYRVVAADGRTVWVHNTVSVILDQGQPVALRGLMTNITAIKQAEEALRASEEQTRMILRTAMDGFWMVDMQGHILTVNEAYCRMTGYTIQELTQMSIQDINVLERSEQIVQHIQSMRVAGSDRFEVRHRCKNGQLIDLEISARYLPQMDCLATFMHDITERKRAEETLRESEARLRMLTNQVPAVLWTVDRHLRFTSSSGSGLASLGLKPGQTVGFSLYEYFRTTDETYFPIVAHQRALEGESVGYELTWADRAFQTQVEPLLDAEGQIVGVIGIATDVTKHQQAEAALREWDRLQMALEKEKQMNTIKSNVMRTISHEFRTPLAIISTSTSLLDRYFDRLTAEQRRERLNTIGHQVQRLNQMIEDISAVVHEVFNKFVFQPGLVNLETLCQSNIAELQSTIGAKHQITYSGDDRLQTVLLDDRLVNRILINLLSNAIKYSPEGSTIQVRARRTMDEVLIQVVDQGIGIAPDDQKRLYEPFFRAANARAVSGSGLGLNIVHDCVTLHQGSITVESELNKGTTFTVRLPNHK